MNACFPVNIEGVNCAWLTRVLQQRGLLHRGSVTRFTVEPVNSGYTSSVYRLLLEFDENSVSTPHSMVAKFHSKFSSIRETFDKYGLYEKEVGFYRFVDEQPGLPVPDCYAAEFEPVSGDFVLLLEDMSAARSGSWTIDAVGDVRIALPQLARIHAQFWGESRLQQFDWIVKPTAPDRESPEKADWEDCLRKVKSGHRDHWPDHAWSLCERILENWNDIMRCMNQDTHTLVHTDPHLGQMFFPSDELPRFILFDWQYPCKSLAAEDVTHLLVSELSSAERREHEVELVDLYYQSLCDAGVTDLKKDRLWFQCKLGLMWLILMYLRTVAEPDLLNMLKDEADEAGERWQDWVFGQLGSAIDDWKLSEVLDQAISEANLLKP